MGEERVYPANGLGRSGRVVAARPAHHVVLTRYQRDIGGHDLGRRPPCAEHVRMHQVGIGNPVREPCRELGRRPPLQAIRLGEEVRPNTMTPGQLEASLRRLTGKQAAGDDSVLLQRARQSQRRQLSTPGLQGPYDADDLHRPPRTRASRNCVASDHLIQPGCLPETFARFTRRSAIRHFGRGGVDTRRNVIGSQVARRTVRAGRSVHFVLILVKLPTSVAVARA